MVRCVYIRNINVIRALTCVMSGIIRLLQSCIKLQALFWSSIFLIQESLSYARIFAESLIDSLEYLLVVGNDLFLY